MPTNKRCTAILHHGPGHQSQTKCDVVGKHDVHHCHYGCYREEAYWKEQDCCTGFFDEPPDEVMHLSDR